MTDIMARRLSSPPARPAAQEAAVVELIRLASAAKTPNARLKAAIAATHASSALSAKLKCHANLAAGTLLHELADEPAQMTTHMRNALGLCHRSTIPSDLRIAVFCKSTAIIQQLLRDGVLKEARELLETVQGALQSDTEKVNEDTPAPDEKKEKAWLSVHVGVLHVSLLLREGPTKPVARLLPSVLEQLDGLPEEPPDFPLAAGADTSESACPTKSAMRRVLDFQKVLLLTMEGELREAVSALDGLMGETDYSEKPKEPPPSKKKKAADDGAADNATDWAIWHEGALLRASIHLAHLEFDQALWCADQLKSVLCGKPKEGVRRPRHLGAHRAHGTSSYLLLLAHAAVACGQTEAAAGLVQKATEELQHDQTSHGPPQAALLHWCKTLKTLLEPSSPENRLDVLRRLAAEEPATKHKLLRGTLFLAQGELSLKHGSAEDAERRMARCVKLSVGDHRCDALAVHALTAIAAAIGAQPGEAGGASSSQGEGQGDPKRRRMEDTLSSALVISSKMDDNYAQRGVLAGWTKHYEAINDEQQAGAFRGLHDEFDGRLKKKIEAASKPVKDAAKKANPPSRRATM